MKHTLKTRAYIAVAIAILGMTAILTLSGFDSALFNINRSNQHRIDNSNEIQAAGSALQEMESAGELLSDPKFSIDNAIKDTITEEMWEEIKQHYEQALQELEQMDWEAWIQQYEQQQQELLRELPERLKEQQLQLQEQLEQMDWEAWIKEYEQQQELLRELPERLKEQQLQLQEQLELMDEQMIREEMEKAIQQSIEEIENIDFKEFTRDLQESMERLNLNMDYENMVIIDVDSLYAEISKAMEDINFEQIRLDVLNAQRELQQQLDSLQNVYE